MKLKAREIMEQMFSEGELILPNEKKKELKLQ